MESGQGIDPFIRWFYICGLSCYPSFDAFLTAKNRRIRFVNYIPTGILFLLTVFTSIGTCMCKYLYDPQILPSTSSLFINTLTAMVTVLVCSIQMVFLLPYFAGIFSQIHIIERLTWRKFSFDMNAFRRHFMQRAYITLFSFILPLVVKIYGKPATWDTFIVAFGLGTLRAFMFMILLHAFFYVDLLDHMLQCFVRHVNVRASTVTPMAVHTISHRSPAVKQLTAEIFHFKQLHFNLWKIGEKINHLFGLTIFIVFMQHFSYAVYIVYIVMTEHSLTVPKVLRKSKPLRCWWIEMKWMESSVIFVLISFYFP